MSKKEFVAAIAEQAGVTKKSADSVLKALADVTASTMFVGEEVSLPGIGKLVPVQRAARAGKNPITGKPLTIKASIAPKFKASKVLKDALNPPALA